tara:strand:+ start:679 stop:924 length:246 start_codon:yes stop_codon:yes gene_type:complete
MIDTTINMGSIITIITVTGTLLFTTGGYTTKIETLENDQEKTVVRVKKVEQDVNDLKVTTAKLETKLDERFDRIEDILMDK